MYFACWSKPCLKHLRERNRPPRIGGRSAKSRNYSVSGAMAFAPGCNPSRYSTALDAIYAAVKIARLSSFRTFSQLAI